MPDKAREYDNFFNETYTLFKRVTSYAILLEKYGGGKVLVASINELRGVLFHLYNFLDEELSQENKQTVDYIEAKEHLFRSYYDLFSKLCAIFAEKIHGYQTRYGVEIMTSVFPDYYQIIFPGLNKLKQDISHVRSTRNMGKGISDNSDKNHAIIVQLLDWVDSLESLTLTFNKKAQAEKKKTRYIVMWMFASAIVGALIAVILTYILMKPQ